MRVPIEVDFPLQPRQVSIIDTDGNVVSLTQTLGRSFGGKVATPGLGFPYNNFLEGFRVDKPQCPGR